ncbi:MAG: 4Fe-4S binding protein [Clostridia bacterium]|nr:4Fe-4S binding protein [Clostridia bacterium]
MKKRQRLRYGILMLFFALFPITLNYYSPYLSVMGPSEGIVNGSLIVFAGLFIGSLFFGRFWCGWLCPAGAAQEACAVVQPKKLSPKWLKYLKYVIYIAWISLIILMFISAGGIIKTDFLYMTDHGISVAQPANYIIYYGVLFIMCILPLIFGKHAACYMICWMAPTMIIGQTIAKWLKLPRLRIKTSAETCVDCKKCDRECPRSLPVSDYVKKGEITDVECSKCFVCVDNCPTKSLSIKFGGR